MDLLRRWGADPSPLAVAVLVGLKAPIMEIGAGGGAWLTALRSAGADVTGYDIEPRDPAVLRGDHIAAALASPDDAALLAVWPPDGRLIQQWILARPWSAIAICGVWTRFDCGHALDDRQCVAALPLELCRKGRSELRIYH